MKDISEYVESGIIEAYVLGMTDPEEARQIEDLAIAHPEIHQAINSFSDALERQATANAVQPDPLIKPLLMATVDFISRMQKGETPSFPPELHQSSTLADYAEWLNRPDFILPADFTDIYAKIIGYTPRITTAIVWIKEMAPQEVHHNEFERFLIVEGSCTITIAEDVHYLTAGDFLSIPLHKNHFVKVTSDIPCKAILQRVAA